MVSWEGGSQPHGEIEGATASSKVRDVGVLDDPVSTLHSCGIPCVDLPEVAPASCLAPGLLLVLAPDQGVCSRACATAWPHVWFAGCGGRADATLSTTFSPEGVRTRKLCAHQRFWMNTVMQGIRHICRKMSTPALRVRPPRNRMSFGQDKNQQRPSWAGVRGSDEHRHPDLVALPLLEGIRPRRTTV